MLESRRITFIRHAMPRVDAGTSPVAWDLGAEGVAAASAMNVSVDDSTAVVSSPERKAVHTVALALDLPEQRIACDSRFREVDRVEQVDDSFREARRAWIAGAIDAQHAGWETPDAVAQRFHAGLLAHAAKHLVVGTHGMALTAWMVSQGQVAPGRDAVEFWESLRLPDSLELRLPLLRVRAVVMDADGRIVVIRRTRPGQQPYWTFPGGGVEPADESPEEALRRELREELGAEAAIGELLHERPMDSIRSERFYAAQLHSIDLTRRSGPEFTDPRRGRYDVEVAGAAELRDRDLRPAEMRAILDAAADSRP